MMKRVVTHDGIEFVGKRGQLNVMHLKCATQRSFVIDSVGQSGHAFAGHFNQLFADINAHDFMAQPCEVFPQPPRSAAVVQNSTARWQRKHHRHVGKIAEVPMHVFVHAFALVLSRLMGEVVERLSTQMMSSLLRQLAKVFASCRFVVDSFHPRKTSRSLFTSLWMAVTTKRSTLGKESIIGG